MHMKCLTYYLDFTNIITNYITNESFQHVFDLSFNENVDYILCIIAFLENFNFVCIKTKTDLLTFSFVE